MQVVREVGVELTTLTQAEVGLSNKVKMAVIVEVAMAQVVVEGQLL